MSKKRLFTPDNKNFLAPVGFKFILDRAKNVEYFCQSVNIPDININTRVFDTRVKQYEVPGDKLQYGDLQLTFMINEDLDNYYEIYNWLKGLTNPEHESQWYEYLESIEEEGRTSAFQKITTDARLLVLDSNYNTTATAIFTNCFPTQLGGIRFSSDQSDIDYVTADVTFKYTLLEFIDKDGNRL